MHCLLFIFTASLWISCAVAHPSVPQLTRSLAPVIAADFPDPSILFVKGVWYAFATSQLGGPNVQVASSTNYVDWHILNDSDALPELPKWKDASKTKTPAWAPDVVQINDKSYVMYFSSPHSSGHHCIGVATSERPEGPYAAAAAPLICPLKEGGAIDASGFQDIDGKRYVTYKIDSNSADVEKIKSSPADHSTCGWSPTGSTPIMLQQVDPNGTKVVGNAVKILDRNVIDGPLIEAPSLLRTSAGKYVLFFSSNCFNGPLYDLSYAIADDVSGPYRKGGPLLMPGDEGLYSPGGADVAPDGTHLVFHAGKMHHREMYAVTIAVDECDQVVITSKTPEKLHMARNRVEDPMFDWVPRKDSGLIPPALQPGKQETDQGRAQRRQTSDLRHTMHGRNAATDWYRVVKARKHRNERWLVMYR